MAESLEGKVAVMTGVGSGFGKATAEKFAQEDQVNLVLIDYDEEALNATAEVCRESGSQVVTIPGDVTNLETFEQALEAVEDNWGKDIIEDYEDGLDQLDLRQHTSVSSVDQLSIVQDGLNVVISVEGVVDGDTITLIGVDQSSLTSEDFLFVS